MRANLLLPLMAFPALALCAIIDPAGGTVGTRFNPPPGFNRIACGKGSFSEFLREFKLKEDGVPVRLFDGRIKTSRVHAAVLDMPFIDRDLIQCADAVIKLRAEYLYRAGAHERIEFTLTNGMKVPFSRFAEGWRIRVAGNRTEWVRQGRSGASREVFDEYLVFIYTYCGTASLSRDLAPADINDIEIGDVFIQGGSPGHVVIVMDLAENTKGEKVMILAQSYMPSQEMHILISGGNISPWYKVEDRELATPEWIFKRGSLKRFPEKSGKG